ncbi:hypothetical protein M0G43_07805 [Subsaxibacter sp. CAU 1640]|uniref:hypothetical protein n=1 Tax=Subsaxibacter sp. CAU 1640 TaxID=2933271 RepID=UPI0020068B4A|nr:hypothetical protein [Subsaxibacter sp. CAU 1640]MCK7590471.1 hypothetical protein [Subsaxibacter sp. CAU 1640]
MRQFIFYEIQTAAICPYKLLFFDQFIVPLKESNQFKFSNIYAFAKVKKLRFDLTNTFVKNKRQLTTTVVFDDNLTKELTVSFFDTAPIFKSVYKTRENFEDMLSDEDDFWSCELDNERSSNEKLHFFQKAKTGQVFEFWMTPENIESASEIIDDIKFDNRPEIVYIGQSFRMIDRISSHKTLHKAVSELSDSEDLRIYFLTFKYGYGGHKKYADLLGKVSQTWLSKHGNSKEYKSKINLVERFLIHFFQPTYNTQHIHTEIQNDKYVNEIIHKNNIDVISINYGIHGKAFEFWSPNQKLNSEIVSFNFFKPEDGYQTGLVTNLP